MTRRELPVRRRAGLDVWQGAAHESTHLGHIRFPRHPLPRLRRMVLRRAALPLVRPMTHALLVLLELAGWFGLLYGLYLLVATSPRDPSSSAGGRGITPVEDDRPATAGRHDLDELAEFRRRRALDRLDYSSVCDRLDRLDDEAGR